MFTFTRILECQNVFSVCLLIFPGVICIVNTIIKWLQMDCNIIHRGVGVFQRVWLMYQRNQVSNAIVAEITGDRKVFDIRIGRCRLLNK